MGAGLPPVVPDTLKVTDFDGVKRLLRAVLADKATKADLIGTIQDVLAALATKMDASQGQFADGTSAVSQPSGDNSTKLATTAFVTAAINALSVIVAAKADATTIANAIAGKADSVSTPTLDSFRSLAMYVARANGKAIGLSNGFVDDFTDGSGLDQTKLSGAYIDAVNGLLLGGAGSQTFARENVSSYPQMTSLNTNDRNWSGYVISASSTIAAANNAAWNAFDNCAGQPNSTKPTNWQSANASLPQWLQFAYPVAVKLAGYAFNGYNPNGAYTPTAWLFQGSTDGTNWTTLDSQTGQTPHTRTVYDIPLANQAYYTAYRIYVTAVYTAGTNVIISCFEPLQAAPLCEFLPLLPAMTGLTTASDGSIGHSITSSRGDANAWYVCDADLNPNGNYWAGDASNASTITNYLIRKTPNPITIGAYAIQGRWNGADYVNYPTAFTLEGSNDGNTWTLLDKRNRSGIFVTNGDRTLYTIAPQVQAAFTYHRLGISLAYDNQNGANGRGLTVFDLLQIIPNGVEPKTSLPFMTGANTTNTGALGHVVSAGSTYQAGYEPWRAMDGVSTSATNTANSGTWVSVAGLSALVRQVPTPIRVVGYRLMNIDGNLMPRAWDFQGSNDGTTWTTLDSRTSHYYTWIPTTKTWHYFSVKTPGSYTYYRINFTTTSNDGYSRVFELELLQGTTGLMDVWSISRPATNGVPAKATLFMALKATAGTITMNTNVIASISRDNGVTFKDFVLNSVGPLGAYTIFESPALDLSTLPSGNQMVARMRSTDATLAMAVEMWMPLWG